MADILESNIILEVPGRYLAWPTLARSKKGALLLAFSGDRRGHVCPFGKTYLMRSEDDGRSWSDPHLVNDTPLDDRDAGLCVCPDGTVVLTWFSMYYQRGHEIMENNFRKWGEAPGERKAWLRHLQNISRQDICRWASAATIPGQGSDADVSMGYWCRRSMDDGITWDEPTPTPVSAPHGPVSLSDNRLLYLGTFNKDRPDGECAIGLAASNDHGKCWQVHASLAGMESRGVSAADAYAFFTEPHLVATGCDDHLVGLFRWEETQGHRNPGRLYELHSRDGGHSWTKPAPTPLWGKPPHLLKLKDGRLLASYGHRSKPFGQRACISETADGGWSADNEIILRQDAPNGDLGYPASVECKDGSILTVYYQCKNGNERPVLMATRWHL